MPAITVDEFINKWSLSQSCINTLLELEPEVQHQVMIEFQPRGNVQNPSDLFAAFARSRARSHRTGVPGATIVTREDVEEFIGKWGLNADSYACLLQLPINVLDSVIRAFNPPETARDINNMFQSFARSRLNNAMIAYQTQTAYAGQPLQGEAANAAANAAAAINAQQQIQSMVAANALGAQMPGMQPAAVAVTTTVGATPGVGNMAATASAGGTYLPSPASVGQLSAEQQTQLLQQLLTQAHAGQPLATSVDSGTFTGTPASAPRANNFKPPTPHQIKEFTSRNALDDTSALLVDCLEAHHGSLQGQLIAEYNPTDDELCAGDPNELFKKFWTPVAMAGLQSNFGLNGDSLAQFAKQDIAVQGACMREFSPRDPTQVNDMNSLFTSFMRSRKRTLEAGGDPLAGKNIPGTSPTNAERNITTTKWEPNNEFNENNIRRNNTRKRPLDQVSGFINQYGLSLQSESLLRQLDNVQQEEILNRFAPKITTRDVDGLFKKFVDSVKQKFSGDQKDQTSDNWNHGNNDQRHNNKHHNNNSNNDRYNNQHNNNNSERYNNQHKSNNSERYNNQYNDKRGGHSNTNNDRYNNQHNNSYNKNNYHNKNEYKNDYVDIDKGGYHDRNKNNFNNNYHQNNGQYHKNDWNNKKPWRSHPIKSEQY